MATYYSQKSGSVSDTTVWNTVRGGGGSAPANFNDLDDDSLVIQGAALGHDVEWDGDSSGWANGIAGITIEGGASPGMLHCKYSADGTYYIKVKTGTTINGTTVTNRGRLLANSDGVWGNTGALPFGRKFTIEFLGTAGTAKVDAVNLDQQLWCTNPVILSVRTYGDKLYKTTDATPLSVDHTTDTFTRNSHGLANATPVMFESTGNLPAPLLRDTLYWVINQATNTFKVAYTSGGNVVDLTDNGSGTISVYNGPGTGTTLNVLDDVTGDATWVTTAGHNRVVLASAGPEAYNQLRTTLATITSTSITLAANGLSNLRPNTRIYLTARNILLKTNSTASAGTVDWGASTFTGSTLQCELWAAAGSGTTFYAYGLNGGYGHTFAGAMVGYTYGTYNGTNLTFSGLGVSCQYLAGGSATGLTLSGTAAGMNIALITGSAGITVSGTIRGCTTALNICTIPTCTAASVIAGCANGWNGVYGGTAAGLIKNCSNGFVSPYGATMSGTVYGCTCGTQGCRASTLITGTVTGCYQTSYLDIDLVVSGTVQFCYYGIYISTVTIIGGTYANNLMDIYQGYPSTIYGYKAALKSTTQVSSYKHSQQSYSGISERPYGVFIYDICDANGTIQPGYVGVWTSGGFTKTAAYSVGTHGTPPTALAAVHVSTFEDSDRDHWVEFRVAGRANQLLNVTVYHKVTSTTGWTTAPVIEICDPNVGFKLANEVLAASAAFSVADTDWHTDRVAYTPAYDRPLLVRIRGCGGNTGGTGTGAMYWWQVIESNDRGLPTIGGRTIRRA